MNLKQRFKIFKRDNFTCVYCGKRPPEVILEVDHAISKKDGGKDNEENLVTSCFECNRGKSKISVDIFDYKKEIGKIEESKIQLDEYYKFLEEKNNLKNKELNIFKDYWEKYSQNNIPLTISELKSFINFKKQYPIEDILDAIDIAWSNNLILTKDKIKYISGILKNKKLYRDNPKEAERQQQVRKNINSFYEKWRNIGKSNYIKWDLKVLIKKIFEQDILWIETVSEVMDNCFKTFKDSGFTSYSNYVKYAIEEQIKIAEYYEQLYEKTNNIN